jgi:hypothetical protein
MAKKRKLSEAAAWEKALADHPEWRDAAPRFDERQAAIHELLFCRIVG